MKKDISDFLKFAYEHDKVRDLSEAFTEFPPEKEWHEGKIENIIKDKDIPYVISYEIGDIVFVRKYKYQNGNFGKNHLFVIIDQNNLMIPIENFGMLISSNLDKLKKTDVIYKILPEQILFKIGKVDKKRIKEYKESFLSNYQI